MQGSGIRLGTLPAGDKPGEWKINRFCSCVCVCVFLYFRMVPCEFYYPPRRLICSVYFRECGGKGKNY